METGRTVKDVSPHEFVSACAAHLKRSGKELGRSALLSYYKEMVLAVSEMVKASKSMRCFLKGSTGSPIVQFCSRPEVINDSGDGGGIPVFSSFSVSDFEFLFSPLATVDTMEDSEATPRRVINLNSRNLHTSSPSPSPSPSPFRLWRPAAQRNIRNQWSKLLSAKDRWLSASSDGKLHATSVVNASLSQRFVLKRDLGVLKDMPAIREKAYKILAYQQELGRSALLSSYKEMVLAVSQMVKASKSMRCFLKGSTGSPIVQFCSRPEVINDSGDGGGIPVFSSFSVSDFEELAQELIAMFVLELALKRFLMVELTSMQLEKEIEENGTPTCVKGLFEGEFDELQCSGLLSDESEMLPPKINNLVGLSTHSQLLSHEASETVLQVYLTSWLANVNLNMSRIDEIFLVVEETMQVRL